MHLTHLNNRINREPDDETRLLYYIKSDPEFQKAVGKFWALFRKDQEGRFARSDFLQLATLVNTLLHPHFTFQQQKQIADEHITKLIVGGNHLHDTFVEYFVDVAHLTVENLDLRSAIGLVQLLWSRLVDVAVHDCRDGQQQNIGFKTQVHIYTREQVDKSSLEQKFEKAILPCTLYYEQRQLPKQDKIVVDEYRSLVYSLKRQQQIIPLGFLAESILSSLSNSNFQIKDSYRMPQQQRIALNNIQIFPFINEKALDTLKDCLLGKQKMHITHVLHEHLPESNIKSFGQIVTTTAFYRLGEYLSRPMYLQSLKTLQGQQQYFNVLSMFYDRDEFGIDEIHNVAEKWHRKKKANLLNQQRKKTIKKQQINLEEQQRLYNLKMITLTLKYQNEERLKQHVAFLRDKLRVSLEQDKVVSLERWISNDEILPNDNDDPFRNDILEYARETPLQLLIIGRAKSGKTTLAKKIAQKYGIIHIGMETTINKVFQRVKQFQQNPPEVDENGVAKDGLTEIEKCIISDLAEGKVVDRLDLIDLLNIELKNPVTASRGYVLDLPFQYGGATDWVDLILSNRLYLPKVGCRHFTHVIELDQTEDQWKYFSRQFMEKPEDLTVSSAYDRYLLVKPKPPKADDEQEEEDPGEEKPAPLNELNLIKSDIKQSQLPNFHSILNSMHPRRHIKLRISGRNSDQLVSLLDSNLTRLPQAKKLQGNEKQLLTVGLEEKKLVRKWSSWGVIDPVQLHRSKLINGKSEFAAQFAGRVFLFENQKNLNDFLLQPRQYLRNKPQLPPTFNIVIGGPRKSGKRTLAKQLSEIYGLKIVNIQQIIKKKLLFQKQLPEHQPSNPTRSTSVHLSEPEWKQFNKGNMLSAKDILPMVLFELGLKLQKKPQDWGIQRTEEEKAQLQKEREDKEREQALKRAQLAKKTTKKKEKEPKEDQRPKTPPPEDIPLKDLIPQVNHFGKLNQLRGYIFVGWPNNQQQYQAMKAFNIPIDKYIYLHDNSEENPNKTLSKRLNEGELEQVAALTTAIGPVKEALTEQVFKEVLIGENIQNLTTKVRNLIDPFYLKPDDDAYNRVSADVQEEDDPVSFGFCDKFCPVVLEEGWLLKGKDTFECGVEGQRYRCFDEKQFNIFKQNPKNFIKPDRLAVPPRILFMGIRGVGLKTELIKINSKYKLPIMNLQDTFLGHLSNQKQRRKVNRYYNKGFKIPEVDESGNPVEDVQLNDDGPDFDRKANEVQVLRNIFNGIEQVLINGNFFDVQEEKVSTGIVELLTEARRLPEVVVILKADEKRWLPRNLNTKVLETKHEQLVEQKKRQRQAEKEEAKRKAAEEGVEYQQPAEEEELAVQKLQDMINEQREKLVARRESDLAKLEQFSQAFKAVGVDVISIDCERDVQHVFDKIVYGLKPYLQNRMSRWEKVKMMKISPERISHFVDNFIVKESRFGKLNPLTLMRPVKPQPLIYNGRIYYFDNEEERQNIMENPQLLRQNTPIPRDIAVQPVVYVIGAPKTGKGSLSKLINKRMGLVIIKVKHIVHEFTVEHRDPTIDKIMQIAKNGEQLTDQNLVDLIEKRVQMADCINRGWLLDGFPRNRNQADMLIKRGFAPTAVFSLQLSDSDIKKRVSQANSKKYGYHLTVLNERIQRQREDLQALEIFFMNRYNNIRFLDGRINKWGIFEAAKHFIEQTTKSKLNMISSVSCRSPISAASVSLSFNSILNNLSDFGNYCLVTYKTQREYSKVCLHQLKHMCIYNRKIYVFAGQKELQDFLHNPDLYVLTSIGNFTPPEIMLPHLMAKKYEEVENKGYCMVDLSRKVLTKGNPMHTIEYHDKMFGIGKASNLKYFLRSPATYEMSKLQDKLPVETDKKSQLKKIAKRSDCTAFLEHHLGNIMMRVLAQLGYRRLKYPTINSKETALKFLAISLKANNPNKDQQYRDKYTQKLEQFIKHCSLPQELRDEFQRKDKASAGGSWKEWDEQNLLKLSEVYKQFDKELNTMDKVAYFSKFIN